ncbi:hypothetical protein BG015_001815 [Linnemannia schmuckeri]|uniref:Fanconi-associated nuclease n=1 Tax=Linnemannia schmuckeri TaxID=64567 RepID=A0A9P5VDW5_9FUNG|nr:hypothetical protein BG015_001815 [Linnemannia schmuckeri]
MKKKAGTTKAKDKDKVKVKTTSTPKTDATSVIPKTGDKRQLPLDFSRHVVVAKKTSPSNVGATKTGEDLDQWRPPPLSELDPPAIRVNLTSSAHSFPSTRISSRSSTETRGKEDEDSWEGTTGVPDEEDPDLCSYKDEGDDDDTLARLVSGRRFCDTGDDDIDGDFEAEGEGEESSVVNETLVKKEETLLAPNGQIRIKADPDDLDQKELDTLLPPMFRWKTVYVAAFELALDTVLPEEAFLFTDEEHTLFETYRALPDDPKHLFVRLFLRNQKYWFRQSKLEGRYREIDDLKSSIRQLITSGLLMDQGSATMPAEVLGILAMDELKILARHVGIKEKLSGKPRNALVSTILDHFRQQSFISKRLLLAPGGASDGGGEARLTGLTTHVFSGDATKRNRALIDKVIDISGPCVKIYPNVIKVFERLHLVFYRAREYNEKPALLEAILAKIGQRTFPTYEITRTNTVFKNRDELLKYETAIRLHFELSKLTESAMGPGRDATVYVRNGDHDAENQEKSGPRRASSAKVSQKSTNNDSTDSRSGDGELDPEQERRRLEVIGIYEKIIEEAENIREAWRHYVATETELSRESPNYFMLRFSPGWVYTQILRLELRAFAFLKRFEEESVLLHELLDQHIYSLGQRGGWYERLALIKSNYSFHKRLGKQEALQVCMMALRDKHVHAVDATLIQARIVRLESELRVAFRERHDFSYLALRKAQKRILTGERLNAPGMVAPSYTSSHSYSFVPHSMGSSHPIANQRPLWRNIDGSDCNVEELALSYYGTLGYKGYHSENSLLATLFGLLFWDILFSPQPGVFETLYQTEPLDLRTDAFFYQRQDMILDRIARIAGSTLIENDQSIAPVPPPSPTIQQKHARIRSRVKSEDFEDDERDDDEEEEPLFSRRRKSKPAPKVVSEELLGNMLFEDELLQEQEDNENSEDRQAERAYKEFLTRKRKECYYLHLIQTHDDLYRDKKVFCVGVNWTFTKEELLEVAECIGGNALAEICKILAQEYNKRCSGMPDLCCWDYDKKLVKFVEVKGPGDRLSSKQQVWIDLLTSLHIDIELCIVQVSKAEDAFLEECENGN